jgi:hypothetical protein
MQRFSPTFPNAARGRFLAETEVLALEITNEIKVIESV